MHSKWSPVSIATFQYEAVIEIDDNKQRQMTMEEKVEIVASCPTKVFDLNSKTKHLEVRNSEKCTFCEECLRKSENMGKAKLIKIEQKKDRFKFYVETVGQLAPGEILRKALQIMKEKLETLGKNIK